MDTRAKISPLRLQGFDVRRINRETKHMKKKLKQRDEVKIVQWIERDVEIMEIQRQRKREQRREGDMGKIKTVNGGDRHNRRMQYFSRA